MHENIKNELNNTKLTKRFPYIYIYIYILVESRIRKSMEGSLVKSIRSFR